MVKRRFTLNVESLEGRQMMAGDVTATMNGGTLYLTEAGRTFGFDNAVQISAINKSTLRVSGAVTSDGTFSKINGADYQDFRSNGNLNVDFGGGRDRVEFAELSLPMHFQDVSINVGVTNASGDSDKDVVTIANVITEGSLRVTTGGSNDRVTLGSSQIGDGVGTDTLQILTGAGADVVSIKNRSFVLGNATITTYSTETEVDDDYVEFACPTYIDNADGIRFNNNLDLRMGAGKDTLTTNPVNTANGTTAVRFLVGGQMNVDLGAGDDSMSMISTAVGDAPNEYLKISAGAGADTIDFNDVSFSNLDVKTYKLDGEVDIDRIKLQSFFIQGTLSTDMGDGDDQFFITDPNDTAHQFLQFVNGSFTLFTGNGNDQVYIEGTSVGSEFQSANMFVNTGAGRDTVTLDFKQVVWYDTSIIPKVFGNLDVQTFTSLSETDRDEVHLLAPEVNGELCMLLGGGDDLFDLLGGNLEYLLIDAGTGNDTGTMGIHVNNDGTVKMGDGGDTFNLMYSRIKNLTLDGGTGIDHLNKEAILAIDHLFETNWEYLNGGATSPLSPMKK